MLMCSPSQTLTTKCCQVMPVRDAWRVIRDHLNWCISQQGHLTWIAAGDRYWVTNFKACNKKYNCYAPANILDVRIPYTILISISFFERPERSSTEIPTKKYLEEAKHRVCVMISNYEMQSPHSVYLTTKWLSNWLMGCMKKLHTRMFSKQEERNSTQRRYSIFDSLPTIVLCRVTSRLQSLKIDKQWYCIIIPSVG